jgi:hypothetical protein
MWSCARRHTQRVQLPHPRLTILSPRDLDNGAPVTDVDIFVKWRSNIVEDLATLQRMLARSDRHDGVGSR